MMIPIEIALLWPLALVVLALAIQLFAHIVFCMGNPWLKPLLKKRRYILKQVHGLDRYEIERAYLYFRNEGYNQEDDDEENSRNPF